MIGVLVAAACGFVAGFLVRGRINREGLVQMYGDGAEAALREGKKVRRRLRRMERPPR